MNKQRNKEIINTLVKEKLTYADLGKMFGITSARIGQIILKTIGKDKTSEIIEKNIAYRFKNRQKEFFSNACLQCGKPTHFRRQYCSKKCFYKSRVIFTPEELIYRRRKKQLEYYYRNRDKCNDWNKKYSKEYNKRPEIIERRKAKYRKIKSDPVEYKKYLEKARRGYKKRKLINK